MIACSCLKENAGFNPNFYFERVTVIFCDRDGLDNLTHYRKDISRYREKCFVQYSEYRIDGGHCLDGSSDRIRFCLCLNQCPSR